MQKKTGSFRYLGHLRPVNWKNSKEMHKVVNSFRLDFKALLLELLDQPLTRHEMRDRIQCIGASFIFHSRRKKSQFRLDENLAKAVEADLLELTDGRYSLTPKGKELVGHIQDIIPRFVNWFFSKNTVSKITIMIYGLLCILKLVVGLLSHSAGLIADGIDNSTDVISSIMVWVGIKFNKERVVSLFILLTMFISVGGVFMTTYNKVIRPEPIAGGLLAFGVSSLFGLCMLGLSAYQYIVGRTHSNLAILCQSVDTRNHFCISMLVCLGILLASFIRFWNVPWLQYGDTAASAIIGILILKSAIELLCKVLKSGDESVNVSHFLGTVLEREKEKIILNWLQAQMKRQGFSKDELEGRFAADFYKAPPKIFTLTGVGYYPQTSVKLNCYLDRFVAKKKLLEDEGFYWLIG